MARLENLSQGGLTVPKINLPGMLLAVLLTQPVCAADLTQVGPQASAAQIIAAAGRGGQPVLRLTFAVSGGPHDAQTDMSADLASDYMLIRSSGRATLYDYKLRRVFNLNEAAHSFSNDSLYALADSRMAESHNRRFLREMLSKLKTPSPLNDGFWDEAELHVADTRNPAPVPERQSGPAGEVHFRYKGSDVADFTPSDQKIAAGEAVALRRLFMEKSMLHPAAIAAMIETGRLPKRLSFALPPIHKKSAEVWMLQSASRLTAAYPLTPGYAAEPLVQRKELSALSALLPVMLEAGRSDKGLRTPDQYQAAIGDALGRNARLQAALLAFEAIEQFGARVFDCSAGRTGCHSLKEIFTEAQKDSRAATMLRALEMEKSDGAKALAEMRAIRRDDVTNPYVIDDFVGNMMSAAGKQSEALPLIAGAVRGAPYVAGYYKDLGDLFRVAFNPIPAWICYDLGRVLPGGASAPVIDSMNQYEARLASDFPQFF